MVYVDPMMNCLITRKWRHKQSCHMVADTAEELHVMAVKIGLKRCWFHNKKGLPHYDLTASRRRLATVAGTVSMDRRGAALLFRRMKNAAKGSP